MKVEEIKIALQKNREVHLEFALIDDIAKKNSEVLNVLEKADKSWKTYQDYLTGADKPFKAMMQSREQYLSATKNITGLLNNAVKLANELGVNVNDVKGYSALQQNIKTGNQVIDIIDGFKDPSSFQ